MHINPYEPPSTDASPLASQEVDRSKAMRSVRLSLLIMLVPAIYNFICFNFSTTFEEIGSPFREVYRVFNSVGLLLVVLAIWFFGLAGFEFITHSVQLVFARQSKRDDWYTILYDHLRRTPRFACFGALLWAIWVAAFYQLQVGFHAISIPIGIAGHSLAAGWYIPLLYRWYAHERK